ncbi:NAD(P)-dependent alcohol dehydrogenase [Actinophytocola sp.]|uniref:NAD(P)-dependent alcohol dehydrogenase n=1 Tax=Actinophytocola sp. TaxID=1872138 RepID=UPI002ED03367
MRAFRLTAPGRPALVEVEVPTPGNDEVLVRVLAAGACHSDLHVIDAAEDTFGFRPPFTLGHEIAGQVAAVGPAATGVEVGAPVAVYGPWGCGECARCEAGADNYCDRRGTLGWAGVGLGRDGGMAEYVLVPSARYLVPTGDLSPTQAAPLSDAGLTPYHAVAALRLDPGSAVAVIGTGGLGHLAVQILRAITPARVLAVDNRESALELAHESGAELATLARRDTHRVLRAANHGVGLDAVLDFVGSDSTMALAAASVRAGGDLVVVGSAGGQLTVGKGGRLPAGARVSLPFWGTRPELGAVVALAQAGRLRVTVEEFPLSAAPEALARLRAGTVRGRAVLVPDQ